MTLGGMFNQLLQLLLVALAAPLFMGWVNACRAWLQNRSAPSLLQPYRVLRKLLHKDAALAENASWLFRFAPYVIFGCMWLVAGIVPVVATELPFAAAADVIALVGVFAVARVFISLAAMDIGTAFGTLGARREMLIGALAEPALLIIFFNFALIEWASAIKLFAYCAIGIACFTPWGIAEAGDWDALPLAVAAAVAKLLIAGAGLAVLETVSAKMRIFRVPEFVATAFMLAMLGLLLNYVFEF